MPRDGAGRPRCVYPLGGDDALSPSRPLAAALLALLVLAAASAEAARVRRPGAQLRAAVGFEGPVLASPAVGAELQVLEVSNEWRRVRTAEGREGWLHELFVEEGAAPARPRIAPSPVPAEGRAAATARPFEAPEVEERTQTSAAAGLARLQRELELERSRADELGRRAAEAEAERDRQAGEAAQARQRAERLEAELAQARRQHERLQADLGGAASAVERSEGEKAAALAALAARHAEEMESLRREQEQALAQAEARHEEELEEARAANAAEIAELQRKLREEQDRIGERFVEDCTALHRRELARELANLDAECHERLSVAAAEHAKELRKVSKESGWEEEFDKEVRQRVKDEVDERLAEAKLRWEARQRGDAHDKERALEDQREELERTCEGRVLTALNAQAEENRREMRERLAAVQAEEERRCRAALELVLRQAAEGVPVDSLREGGGGEP